MWEFAWIQQTPLSIYVPRSDWLKDVLEPIGVGNYVFSEIRVPKVPDRERSEKALKHLRDAEEQFRLGNDPGVFQSCRAVFEEGVLERAPKNIFAAVADEEKRKRGDQLLKEAVAYFHSGRHPSRTGPSQGEFPVDHRDAEFALSLLKSS